MTYNQSPLNHNHGSVTHTSCASLDMYINAWILPDQLCPPQMAPMFTIRKARLCTSMDILTITSPVQGRHYLCQTGGMYTNWDFYTTINDGHCHHVSGPDMPAV